MNSAPIIKIFLLALLAYTAPIVSGRPSKPVTLNLDAISSAQIQFASIVVNGRTLTGPNSSAQRRDGRILIPIMAIARALGDAVNIDATARVINVRRQTGVSSDFDARLGQVRENGSSVLTISNAGAIIFTPNAAEFLLPAEIAAALFDVAVRYDGDKNAVVITRGRTNSDISQSSDGRGFVDLYQLNYEYNLNRYSSAASQDLTLTAAGRLADGRFYFSSNSSRSPQHGISMRNGTFNFERPNGQRFVAGDLGTGANLQFLSGNIRGGSASIPVGDTVVTVFGGRAYSGLVLSVYDPLLQTEPVVTILDRFRYDTNVFGFFATTNSPTKLRRANPLNFSAGAMRFSGANRSGDLVSGGVNYDTSRIHMQGDIGYGHFAGLRADNSRFTGYAAAIDLAGTFQLTSQLAVQARYARIGENFLSPQSGLREPIDLKAAGVTWSPKKWFSTSVNASVIHRPGDRAKRDEFVTTAFSVTPGGTAPRFYFSHTQSSTSQLRSAAFTLFNASKEFSRWRLFINATRIKTFGPASYNSQVGANFRVNDGNQIEVSQGVGSKGSYNGQFDWRYSGLLNHRLSFSAGGGYNYGQTSKFSGYERLTASLNLPRQSSVQLSYINTNAGPTLMVSIRGTLFRKRDAAAFLNAPASEVNSFAKVAGRVYQDINLNGVFDAGVDQPQADVKVRVDGNRYVVSDANGMYQFDSVTAGDHKVYLDLLSVRADLTLLDGDARAAALRVGRNSTVDFRLVRTGRLTGRVWLDLNGNGKFDEGEKPLADVRVVTGSGRDTLTDADGNFVIGDLAPGEHIVLIDEKTLPEKTMSGFKPLAMQVYPGRETSDVDLAVIVIPAEVKRFPAKPTN